MFVTYFECDAMFRNFSLLLGSAQYMFRVSNETLLTKGRFETVKVKVKGQGQVYSEK